jgi:predicted Zn-dependent protease with MMP-like domain
MYTITQKEFEGLVQESVEALPKTHKDKITNIGFFVRDVPSQIQAQKAKLQPGNTLFGLYEGVPLSQRNGVTMLMPDTITIFQKPIESHSNSLSELRMHIKHTVWHEVAHYFGLDHAQIHNIERLFEEQRNNQA